MKCHFFAYMFLLILMSSCSSREGKEQLLSGNLNILIEDNKSWQGELKNYISSNEKSQEELKRRFYSNYSTAYDVYFHVSTIAKYYDVDNQLLVDYSLLLEERQELASPFYKCEVIPKSDIQQLVKVEDRIIKKLIEIQRDIEK